jgi:hypothetical protein
MNIKDPVCVSLFPLQAHCHDPECPAFGRTEQPALHLFEVICRRRGETGPKLDQLPERKAVRIEPIIKTTPKRGCVL